MSKGTIGILNVGAGDTKLTFDKDNPMERARSARIVADMIRRGYVLFIETGVVDGKPTYQRVLQFREDVCEYIIADVAADMNEGIDDHEHEQSGKAAGEEAKAIARAGIPKARKGGRPRRSVDASEARGIAVARSAGG
jgi:hypothetical protein